jgi:phage tail protein X
LLFMASVQARLVPLHAPLHPAKKDPLAGAAVSFTEVPATKAAEQVGLQVIPAGLLVTFPDPVPFTVAVSV